MQEYDKFSLLCGSSNIYEGFWDIIRHQDVNPLSKSIHLVLRKNAWNWSAGTLQVKSTKPHYLK